MATTLPGALGADTITGTIGADTLVGGMGSNTYVVNSLLNVIVEPSYSTVGSIDTIQTSVLDALKTFSLQKYAAVENLTYTGTAAAQLVGNAGNNVIKANASTTVISNDTLNGGDGNDALYGYAGNDSLIGGRGNDTLDGGAGNDTLIGGSENDTYINVTSADTIIETAGGGFDTISTNASGGKYLDLRLVANVEGLTYNSTTAQTLNGNNASNLISSIAASGNDTLNGWGGNDTLKGGGGDDLLDGGDGNDWLKGEDGSDRLVGGDGNDRLDGGAGIDTLVGGAGDDIYVADSSDTVTELAGGGIDTLIGSKTSIAVAAYATTIENVIYTGIDDAAVTGNDMNNAISGGSGKNTISAGAGNDVIVGGGGADSIIGGAGNDFLYGGALRSPEGLASSGFTVRSGVILDDNVADVLNGGAGSDRYLIDNTLDTVSELATDTGMDVIVSTIDNSLGLAAYANVEALVLDDDLSGFAAAAWFAEGNAGNNVLVGNKGENYLSGGSGNDTLAGSHDGAVYTYPGYPNAKPTDVLDGGAGSDVLLALTQPGFRYPGYEASSSDVLMGGADNDFYVVQNGDTAIHDSAGTADTLYLMTSEPLEAIDGIERIVLAGGVAADDTRAMTAINNVRQAAGSGVGWTSDPLTAMPTADALNATGNAQNNTIIGNANNNLLMGMAGNDSLTGGAGNDTLIGGTGADTLVGGIGDDVYEVDAGDVVTELAGGGTDIIRSSTLTSYAAFANVEGLEYTGTAGVLLQGSTTNTVAEKYIGGVGNDTINGYDGNDTLTGGAGNDSVNGGDGADYLMGNLGADTLVGGLGNDVLYGGDVMSSTPVYTPYPATPVTDLTNTLYGGAGNDTLYGGTGADRMYGDDDSDVLYGGLGADTLDGGAGNDTLYAADQNSYSSQDVSVNVLNGGDGMDYLYGAAGNDSLSGGNDNDVLYGYAGNDTLNGGLGNDTLTGGAGNDVLYAGAANASVSSYSTSGDRLVGDESYLGSGVVTGNDIFRFESTAAFAGIDGYVYNPPGTTTPVAPPKTFSTGHFIDDFQSGSDKIQFAKSMVGDADTLLEGVTIKATAGGTFVKSSEMVIVQADLASKFGSTFGGSWNSIAGNDVVNAIGTADAAFAIGDKRLFVVDDGISSAMFQFVSADADAVVSVAELKLIGVVDGQTNMTTADFGVY